MNANSPKPTDKDTQSPPVFSIFNMANLPALSTGTEWVGTVQEMSGASVEAWMKLVREALVGSSGLVHGYGDHLKRLADAQSPVETLIFQSEYVQKAFTDCATLTQKIAKDTQQAMTTAALQRK